MSAVLHWWTAAERIEAFGALPRSIQKASQEAGGRPGCIPGCVQLAILHATLAAAGWAIDRGLA